MVLKLNGADFSANNLGQIEVTTVLHPFTEAAILASGNNSLTNVQKSALNALFLSMGVDGSNDVMSKMHRVYLPIIAGNIGKALVNYQNDSFNVDKTLDDSHWTIRNHGLIGIASGQNINFTESNPILANNISVLWLRTETMVAGVADASFIAVLRGKTDTTKFLGIENQSVSSDGYITLGTYGNWNGGMYKSQDVVRAYYAIHTQDKSITNFHNDYRSVEGSLSATPDMSGETSQTLYILGLNTVQTTKPYAVVMLGEALTKAQSELICEKINNLWATFNV